MMNSNKLINTVFFPFYFSLQHLTTLLASCDMQVVLSVLNLLYVFSKRSNYITRLGSDKRTPLLARLQHLAEVHWKALLTCWIVVYETEHFLKIFVLFCRAGEERRMALAWLSAAGICLWL